MEGAENKPNQKKSKIFLQNYNCMLWHHINGQGVDSTKGNGGLWGWNSPDKQRHQRTHIKLPLQWDWVARRERREGNAEKEQSQVQDPQQRIVLGKLTWQGVSREGIE
jgi:hypothetical protein